MIKIYPNQNNMSDAAAKFFITNANSAIEQNGRFCISLSGGSTPQALYEKLANTLYFSQIDWNKVFIFWGDERFVPPDDALSNQCMTHSVWLNHIPIPKENIFPIPFLESSHAAAFQYEESLRAFFGRLPRFDLTLLGIGLDGHTASLFPGTPSLFEKNRWVMPVRPSNSGPERITLTYPVLNNSAHIWFLAAGSSKAEILRQILEGHNNKVSYPAENIAPVDGDVMWLVDQEAAAKLSSNLDK